MAFEIAFYSDGKVINTAATSGLAFFGQDGVFGSSILVGAFNKSTFISDGNGSVQSYAVNQAEYISLNSGKSNNAAYNIHLSGWPNYLATLNIKYTNSSAVKIQNTKLYAHQRGSGIGVAPEGISVYAAEINHPYPQIQTAPPYNGSGNAVWVLMQGTGAGSYLNLVNSPGPTGFYASYAINGAPISSTIHEHFVNISVSPNNTGAKLNSLVVETEYL